MEEPSVKRWAIIDDYVFEVNVYRISYNGRWGRLGTPMGRGLLLGFNMFETKKAAQEALNTKLQGDIAHAQQRISVLMGEIEDELRETDILYV